MTKNAKRAGVITIEVELLKPLSRMRKVALELAWEDMLDLPLSTDKLQIDRMEINLTLGPADDGTILDAPNSLQDFTWQGTYDSGEWVAVETFIANARHDRRVLNVKAIR
jgi:hypothetical protein